MTVLDLIQKEDYDYIEWRLTVPYGKDVFSGACRSSGGKLIPLDGDSYSTDEEVIRHEKWAGGEVKNGLTVVTNGVWS